MRRIIDKVVLKLAKTSFSTKNLTTSALIQKTSLFNHSNSNISIVNIKKTKHFSTIKSSESIITTKNGDIYEGELKDGVIHGFGMMRYRDGDTYKGMWVNGVAHGTGVFSFVDLGVFSGEVVNDQISKGVFQMIDGDVYEGCFANDSFNGEGIYTYKKTGKVYQGTFLDGMRHGNGLLTDPNSGESYSGAFHDDLPHGHGVHKYANGDLFEGLHVDGEWSEGRFCTPSGSWYEGSFREKEYEGQGELGGPAGEDQYTGGFKGGRFHGQGRLLREGVFRYEGDWEEGAMRGHGVFTNLVSGDVYSGEFLDGRFEGSGVLLCEDGDVEYKGEFRVGQKSGHGAERRLSSGETYDGQWSGDLRHGHGAHSGGDGVTYEGSWVQGEICGHGEMTSTLTGEHYLGELLAGRYHGFGMCSRLGSVDRTVSVNIALAETRAAEARAAAKIAGESATGEDTASVSADEISGTDFDPNIPATAEEEASLSPEWRQELNTVSSAHVSSLYEGDFQHGLQHGEGKLVYPNGSQYVGAWEADQMHGYGVLRDAEGGVAHQGRFERGLFVEAVEVPMFRNKRGLGADDQLEVSVVRDQDFGAFVRARFEREKQQQTGGSKAAKK